MRRRKMQMTIDYADPRDQLDAPVELFVAVARMPAVLIPACAHDVLKTEIVTAMKNEKEIA